MPVPILPAVVTAAEWLLPLLLSEGLGAITGSGKNPIPTPGIEAKALEDQFKKMSKRFGPDTARNFFLKRYGERALKGTTASGAAYKSLKPGIGNKMKGFGKIGLAATAGALPFILLPELLGALHGGGGGMEMGGGGASPQDLQSLLGGLQQQAGGSYADTREDYYNMLGSRSAQGMADAYSSDIPTAGIRSDLQTLIRGYEDQIGRMSSTEPTSLAQAFAMEGIYPSRM